MATLGDVMIPQVTLGQMMQSTPGNAAVPNTVPQPTTVGDAVKKPKVQWWQLAGILGDALQSAGGGRGTFVPAFLEEKAQQNKLQQAFDLAEKQFGYDKQLEAMKDHRPALAQNFDYWQQMSPDQKTDFLKYQDATNPLIESTWQGPTTVPRVPNVPTRPVGKLTPIEPTMQNTSAPALGGNGLPPTLTPEQYQAIVTVKGKPATDAWLAQHPEIKVGGA